MSIKFGSVVVLIVFLFIAKISIENINSAQARETASTTQTLNR